MKFTMEETSAAFHIKIESNSVAQDSVQASSPQKPDVVKGLTVLTAAIFMAGEMAGSGVLALPKAVADAGWIGILLVVLCCANAGFTGSRLGSCWTIIEERYPEYREKTRSPYPTIGFKAFGPHMRRIVSVCVTITLYGTGTVFLLLVAQLMQGLFCSVFTMSYCYWLLVIGACLTPATWLGTPKDFWPIAVGALVATTIACGLVFIQTILDIGHDPEKPPVFPPATFQNFCMAFGTILFAFGGASTFPTIQNDMKERQKFPQAVLLTFIVLLLLYVPVATAGYFVFGSNVNSNIVQSLSGGPVKIIVQSLLALHLLCAFCIVLNPVSQELEEHLHLPSTFGWKRCVFRTIVVFSSIFLALSIPNFGNILSLVGGSTITLLTFVFPPLFYMRLCDQKQPGWPESHFWSCTKPRNLTLHERTYLIELIVIGILGGATATWSAVSAIVSSETFTVPCYINPSAENYITCQN